MSDASDERPERPAALVDNAGDEQQVAKAVRVTKRRAAQHTTDLRAVLATPEGRRVLWRLMGQCGTYESIYDATPHKLAYNAGKQDVGHFLMAEINTAQPGAFLTMMQESATESAA